MRSRRSAAYGANASAPRQPLRTVSATSRTSRSAMLRPWPVVGSLCPAASPTSTTPGAKGGSFHVSSFG